MFLHSKQNKKTTYLTFPSVHSIVSISSNIDLIRTNESVGFPKLELFIFLIYSNLLFLIQMGLALFELISAYFTGGIFPSPSCGLSLL